MSGDSEPVVSLRDTEVHFEESGGILGLFSEPDTVRAVDGVSLDIHENEVIALVGESGCGKTTLGKTAIGIQRPTDGTVTYRGQDIWAAKDNKRKNGIPYEEIRRSLQIIHQDPGGSLNPNRTVIKSLSEPLKRWQTDLTREDRRARLLGLLDRVGMTPPHDYAERYPHQLSGGEKQRVALIRALVMNPDLVLADEAISALDVSLRIEMMDLMHELQDMFDTSFLFISHDLSNARYFTEKVGGRIGIMYLGELVEIGPTEQIIHNPRHPYTKALRWATPDLRPGDPRPSAPDEELPIKTIDIPDPVNPPSGCRFHTRCPSVIPPEDIEIEQERYNEVMDYRERLADGDLTAESVRERIDSDESDDSDTAEKNRDTFKRYLFRELFSHELTGENRAVVEQSFEALFDGEEERAAELLRERFESVCETVTPTLQENGERDHPAACHLYGIPGSD